MSDEQSKKILDLRAKEADKVKKIVANASDTLADESRLVRIPESIFIERYVNELRVGHPYAVKELTHLVGGDNRRAVIVDENDEKIFILPPLTRSPNLADVGMMKTAPVASLGDTIINKNSSKPGSGEETLNNFIDNTMVDYEDLIIENQKSLQEEWRLVFERYPKPKTVENEDGEFEEYVEVVEEVNDTKDTRYSFDDKDDSLDDEYE